jgi:hypothetical protein
MQQFLAEHRAAAEVAAATYQIQFPYGIVQHDGVDVKGCRKNP